MAVKMESVLHNPDNRQTNEIISSLVEILIIMIHIHDGLSATDSII